jgi:formamidopyrimidine-DNA glycosylase
MPELPEVDLVARALRSLVVGTTVYSAEILRPRLVTGTTPEQFVSALKKRSIRDVSRRGKFILTEFDGDLTLLTHLRMSGRFGYFGSRQELPKHTHAIFQLNNGMRLAFSDQRHFGMMKIVPSSDLYTSGELADLGPEPISDAFTKTYLAGVLGTRRRSIKEVLMDQSVVAGLGNIYVSEVLFRARVKPTAIANRLSVPRLARIHAAIVEVIQEALEASSIFEVDPENINGSYSVGAGEEKWRVYDRENQECHVCRARIRRVVQSGRSSYFCGRCQRV